MESQNITFLCLPTFLSFVSNIVNRKHKNCPLSEVQILSCKLNHVNFRPIFLEFINKKFRHAYTHIKVYTILIVFKIE